MRDAFELVFDRVFDGDDFVFVVLDFAERGVKGGRFARAGGTCDQDHPVRFSDVAAEFGEVGGAEAHDIERELGELLGHRFFVEHAEDGVFPVNGGHDGNAEIDEAGFVAHAEAAVLGDAALSDIEFAHDFNARNDSGVPVLRDGRHGVVEDAVDAVLDDDFLDRGIRCGYPTRVTFEGVEDGGIDRA